MCLLAHVYIYSFVYHSFICIVFVHYQATDVTLCLEPSWKGEKSSEETRITKVHREIYLRFINNFLHLQNSLRQNYKTVFTPCFSVVVFFLSYSMPERMKDNQFISSPDGGRSIPRLYSMTNKKKVCFLPQLLTVF